MSIDCDCINFTWSGMASLLPNYIDDILKMINDIKTIDTSSIFNDAKENLLREWRRWYLEED